MNPVAEYLAASPLRSGTLILDGALATELERRGADLRDPLWSARLLIEQPQLIRQLHHDYFAAGADVATTATYQASFAGFAGRGIDADAAASLMRSAVALARAAREEFWSVEANRRKRLKPLVAASIGPYGAVLADGSEYRGHYALSDAELADFHRPRLAVLAGSGADLIAVETVPCEREALVLARLLRECAAPPAWIAFTCKDGRHTAEGQPIAGCVAKLQQFTGIVAVGVNCTAPAHVLPLLREMRTHTDKPLLAYPNSGEHYDGAARRWGGSNDAGAGTLASGALEWCQAGARLIGGCCRTAPADIRALRATLA